MSHLSTTPNKKEESFIQPPVVSKSAFELEKIKDIQSKLHIPSPTLSSPSSFRIFTSSPISASSVSTSSPLPSPTESHLSSPSRSPSPSESHLSSPPRLPSPTESHLSSPSRSPSPSESHLSSPPRSPSPSESNLSSPPPSPFPWSPTPSSIPYLSLPTHPASSKYRASTPRTSATKTNYICSCLVACRIRTNKDLKDKFPQLLEMINRNPTIFNTASVHENYEILQSALNAYNAIDSLHLNLSVEHLFAIRQFPISPKHHSAPPQKDDFMRVTQAYEDLEMSRRKLQKTSERLISFFEDRDHISCPNVILGCGDTGTTIWLEKYKRHHDQTQSFLRVGRVPFTLMIGENFGSWGHNYTLAQPHSLLERCGTKSNPSDYMSEGYYRTNPYTNSRHIMQANMSNLANTDAPVLLDIHVDHIEKRSNHRGDWKEKKCKYRLVLSTPYGKKMLYTNKMDISTGLGPPKNAIGGAKNKLNEEVISQREFERLNRFDSDKNFTPIIDGNQFVLMFIDQLTKHPRVIVIYGGGGTAAACWRIAFHDHDMRTEGSTYDESRRVNDPKWISARGFEAAGSGKLVNQVFEASKKRNSLLVMELMSIKEDPRTGKLKLLFQPPGDKEPVEIECDQLVYSIGQDNTDLMQMTQEIDSDVSLVTDKTGMPVCVTNPDRSIHFFGAGAMAMRGKEYGAQTWKWLDSEQIGRDVGPGSMPPTRAQIRGYLASQGKRMKNVNVNMDNQENIKKFLARAGVPSEKIRDIIKDILLYRNDSPCGMSKEKLHMLLEKHEIEGLFRIKGHSYLVPKKSRKTLKELI